MNRDPIERDLHAHEIEEAQREVNSEALSQVYWSARAPDDIFESIREAAEYITKHELLVSLLAERKYKQFGVLFGPLVREDLERRCKQELEDHGL